MKLRNLAHAAVLLVAPAAAHAALIEGQLDLVGTIAPTSTFAEDNFFVDFIGVGRAQIATGDFDAFVIDLDEPGIPTQFTLFDVTGTGPAVIYSGAGFTFTANTFFDFVAAPLTPRGFQASGILTGNGFDPTPGLFAFSTQSTGNETVMRVSFSSETTTNPAPIPVPAGFVLLGTALAGLGMARRKKA